MKSNCCRGVCVKRLSFECDPQQCRNDSGTCDKCAAQRSGNFRLSAGPATMIHGNFENAQTRSGGTHLHLDIPSVGWLAHAKSAQRIAPDGAKWAHVGVTNTVKHSQNQAGHSSRNNLLEIHAARLALAARARTDHEIVFSTNDWIDELIYELRAIAAVPVEKNDDIAFRAKSANTGSAGASIPALWLGDHARARGARAFGGLISAAIIDNDDVARNVCGSDRSDYICDRFLFVEGWNNDAYHP
jgi:hypothetical protein